jgi:hypothetical protein
LTIIKNDILKLPNKQIIHQILRLSFSAMINHLQRTTPSSLLSDFVMKFDNLKKDIFRSIIGSDFSELHWKQACFGLEDAGLGYHDVLRTGTCAYVCGIFQNREMLIRLDPNIFHSNIPTIIAFNESCALASLLQYNDFDPTKSWSLDAV